MPVSKRMRRSSPDRCAILVLAGALVPLSDAALGQRVTTQGSPSSLNARATPRRPPWRLPTHNPNVEFEFRRRVMNGLRCRVSLACAVTMCVASPVRAQSIFASHVRFGDVPTALTDYGEQVIQQPAGPPPTPRHTGLKAMAKDLVEDVKHLPSKENLFWAGLGGGLALAVH